MVFMSQILADSIIQQLRDYSFRQDLMQAFCHGSVKLVFTQI